MKLVAHLRRSIRLRLLVSLLSVIVLAALLLGALSYRSVRQETETLFDYQLRQMALSLRDQGAISRSEAQALANPQLDFVVQIWAVDGTLLYASRPEAGLPPRAVLNEFTEVQAGHTTWRVYSTGARSLFGDRIIQVAQPLRIREHLAAAAALRSVLPLLALMPLLGVAVWWLVERSLRPLQRVAQEVRQRTPESLEPVQAAALPEEIAPLVQALNGLLGQLHEAFETQRGFVSNAAHELRSPLTALKLQVQVLERLERLERLEHADPGERTKAIADLRLGVDRATRMVEQLLTLARHEPGAPARTHQPLDLVDIVRQAIAETVPLAAHQGVELELNAPAAVQVAGDADALRILARNLVDNAVRYTPAGGRVRVAVCLQDGQAGLAVDDSGPGIPPEERERVFDRFYRGRTGTGDGTGLGLAIVRSIAERHGAALRLTDSPQGGLRVELRMGARVGD